jgi:hypothetical protein
VEDILIGVTDRTIPIFIPDPSSTTGAGKTGLAAAAVTVTYTRYETDNDVVTTDVTSSVNDLSALTDAHNDWGWKEVSATLSKGQYRLDVADAVFASGAWYAVVQVTITSGTAAATPKAFKLVAYNPLDAVRLGLTALPNAAADAAGGLPISDAGGLDLDAKLANTNEITVARMGALTDWINGGRLDLILDIIAADTTTDIPATITTLQSAVDAIDNLVDDLESRVGTPSNFGGGATLSANLSDIEAQTDDIGTAGAGLTAVPWNAAWDAEVQSEAEDALVTHRLDELVNADSDIDGAAPPTVGSVFHELMTKTAGSFTYDQTTDSQEAVRDRGDAAWTTATGFSTHSAADVWAAATRTLTAFDSSFKTGYALSSAGVQAIWDALTSALTTVGSIGKLLVDNLNATISSRSSQTSVDDLPTNAELTTALGTADDATLAAIAALNNLSQANIRTAVGLASANLDTQLDALPTATENADAYLARDLGSGTGAGTLDERTVRSALRFNRNKFTIAGGTLTVYKEDDSTVAFTAAITQTAGDPVSASDPT